MKRSFALITLLLLSGMIVAVPIAFGRRNTPVKEEAVVEFTESVKLMGVLLKGEYLVVHDEERMARGEPCTYVYSGRVEQASKLVTSFHCLHAARENVGHFTVTLDPRTSAYQVLEIREIQFANTTDGHRVPR